MANQTSECGAPEGLEGQARPDSRTLLRQKSLCENVLMSGRLPETFGMQGALRRAGAVQQWAGAQGR